MPYYDIITLIGFGFGVALAILLFSLSLQRMSQRSVEVASGILFLSIVFWFGGNFLGVLSNLLFGPFAKTGVKIFMALAYLGLAVTPSAVSYTHLTLPTKVSV